MRIFDSNRAAQRASAPGLKMAWSIVNNGLQKAIKNMDWDSIAYWGTVGKKLEMWVGGFDVPTPRLFGVRRGTEHLPLRYQEMIEAPIDSWQHLRLLAVDVADDEAVATLFGSGGRRQMELFC